MSHSINPEKSSPQQSSPQRIYQAAAQYSTTLSQFHEMPQALSKSMAVKRTAEVETEKIRFAIQDSKYRAGLFQQLEQNDQFKRRLFEQKIQSQIQRASAKNEEGLKKKHKEAELYNKHLEEVKKRYAQEEKKQRQAEKEEALKLRKGILQFYEKEAQRRREAENRQVRVPSCYQNSKQRMSVLEGRNEQYAQEAQIELQKELNRNNGWEDVLERRRKTAEKDNLDKHQILNKSMHIQSQHEAAKIQIYGRTEDCSLRAFQKKERDCAEKKQKIAKFLKTRTEKWREEKKRVDARRSESPERCLSLLERTGRAKFRQTVSAFRESGGEWLEKVSQRKAELREEADSRKDRTMRLHLDLRLRNTSSVLVTGKLSSMRSRARKLAVQYL